MVALATTPPGRHFWSPGRGQTGQLTMVKAIIGQKPDHFVLSGQAERKGPMEGALLITWDLGLRNSY